MPLTTPKTPAMRLPPLQRMRLRNPTQPDSNPCTAIMASVLGCWASSGFSITKCSEIEENLRTCMDAGKPKDLRKNRINSHLTRLYPKIIGPHKYNK